MKIATSEPTSVMECETRHQALRFVLIVTHTRHELKSLLEYGTVGGADPQPLPITVTNYASACMHQARDMYQYIADLIEFRLRERTKVLLVSGREEHVARCEKECSFVHYFSELLRINADPVWASKNDNLDFRFYSPLVCQCRKIKLGANHSISPVRFDRFGDRR